MHTAFKAPPRGQEVYQTPKLVLPSSPMFLPSSHHGPSLPQPREKGQQDSIATAAIAKTQQAYMMERLSMRM